MCKQIALTYEVDSLPMQITLGQNQVTKFFMCTSIDTVDRLGGVNLMVNIDVLRMREMETFEFYPGHGCQVVRENL